MKKERIIIHRPIPLYWGQKFKQLLNNNTNEEVILKFLKFIDKEEKELAKEFQYE